MKVPFLIIGGGLSGLAAAIRFARYSPDVLLIEKHNRPGGLNSYYYRNKALLETGLHAVTNYAPPERKHAPLNKLFRQLKMSRKNFEVYPQFSSEINFSEHQKELSFSNDFRVIQEEVASKFPSCRRGFMRMVNEIDQFNPFVSSPFRSAKKFIFSHLEDELLTEMLLCPLMFYGSSVENDIDLSQFVIMFRSIFQEGMFRPAGTMKSFLDKLCQHYEELGGSFMLNKEVEKIRHQGGKVLGVELKDGQFIECDFLLSTIGLSETYRILGEKDPYDKEKRLGFIESIFLLDRDYQTATNKTIIFFNRKKRFDYVRPEKPVDLHSGVICFPGNFRGRPQQDFLEVRSTHLANYSQWKLISDNRDQYLQTKKDTAHFSAKVLEKFIGNFQQHVIYQDTFTPLTIEKYTAKKEGAIYGCPAKIKDGDIGFSNLFLAGTDQGFLGIIGSMLSGVSMVNKHILPRM